MKRVGVLTGIGLSVVGILTIVVLLHEQPPLRISSDNRGVHVDVQTLGEYPTDVAKVRLIDNANGAVVWEVRSDSAQLSTFDLNTGENSVALSHVAWGNFEVVVPNRAKTFTIERRHLYTLEVWGTSLSITRRRAKFSAFGPAT